jgi:hypothetical protein
MHIHPDLVALRSDRAAQRRAIERMRMAHVEWLDQALQDELAAYAAHGRLDELPALAGLLSNQQAARVFANNLTAHFSAALREEPFGEVPFRRSLAASFSRLDVMQSGGAVLSLCCFEPAVNQIEPDSALFVDSASHEIVITGKARGWLRTRGEDGRISSHPRVWSNGDRIVRRPRRDTRHIVEVERSLLILQLTRSPARPEPTTEYLIEDSSLLRETSGDRGASEQVMALGVLGALGKADSVAPMVEFAHTSERDPEARWEAVRQVLALDAGQGTALLARLMADLADPLAAPAARLHAQLLDTHPALRTPTPETA